MATDTLTLYNTTKSNADFLLVVYFRGHWCPFCLAWLHDLESLRSKIEAKNGAILAVTAEADSELGPCRKIFKGTIISDPENSLAKHLHQANLVDVALSAKGGYPQGVAQPAVLAMRKDERLYSWACIPATVRYHSSDEFSNQRKQMNMGGARDRPSLSQVTDNVLAQIAGKLKPHTQVSHQSLFWNGFKSWLFG